MTRGKAGLPELHGERAYRTGPPNLSGMARFRMEITGQRGSCEMPQKNTKTLHRRSTTTIRYFTAKILLRCSIWLGNCAQRLLTTDQVRMDRHNQEWLQQTKIRQGQ